MSKQFFFTQNLDSTLHIEFNMQTLSYLAIRSLSDNPTEFIMIFYIFHPSQHLNLIVIEQILHILIIVALVSEVRRYGRVCCPLKISVGSVRMVVPDGAPVHLVPFS